MPENNDGMLALDARIKDLERQLHATPLQNSAVTALQKQVADLISEKQADDRFRESLEKKFASFTDRVGSKPKPDPRRLMAEIQAERELDESGPITWHELVKEKGHTRVRARQLLANERDFRIAIARWYKSLGADIVAALAAHAGGRWRETAAAAVTEDHRERLRAIVEEHVRRGAILSAAIEFEMHKRRASAKAVLEYVQKGFWDLVKHLPKQVLDAVKVAVAGIMAVFVPDRIIDPILEKVENSAILKLTQEPLDQPAPSPAEIADAVQAEVFSRPRTEIVATGVAVTSNTTASNVGARAAGGYLAETGAVNSKRWACVHGTGRPDAKTRPTHRSANGQTVGINESFVLQRTDKVGGTETCDYPGAPGLSEGNSRYCRCLSIYLWVEERVAA